MQKLQLNYVTWQRPDANGLFDYQSVLDNYSHLTIQSSGYIYRNTITYNLAFVPKNKSIKIDNSKQQNKILKIVKKDNHYLIQHMSIPEQPLCKIISHQKHGYHKVKVGDLLRLGKVQLKIMSINKKHKTHYLQIQRQMQSMCKIKLNKITPSFYDMPNESASMIQDNPTCRYCYGKTITELNPFIISCSCKGFTKYIHEECLLEWMIKKGKLQKTLNKQMYFIDAKIFRCELCHNFYELNSIFEKFYRYQYQRAESQSLSQAYSQRQHKQVKQIPKQLMILYFKFHHDLLYFIDIKQTQTISIGRSMQCDIVLNQLSVSRIHAILHVNSQDRMIMLQDNQSKFGTLHQFEEAQIQNNQTYQVGRSKINFKKIKRKSLFDRIGFCLFQQKVHNEKQKD